MFDTSLRFIKDNFQTLPKVAFSIDGFGHSALTPYLFKALGYEGLVLYRMPYELYQGFSDSNQFFFTWEGDNAERIRVYRLVVYSLDERFNLDRSEFQYDACFHQTDTCAELFLDLHISKQIFNVDDKGGDRMAYQTFGTDFAFQDTANSFRNVETILKNLDRYLSGHLKFEFTTFSQLHHKYNQHPQFDDVLPGDMLVYTEKNNDSWSGYYGSKPDLKMHIKRVFNDYRATESLVFLSRVEVIRLNETVLKSEHLNSIFKRKVVTMEEIIENNQKTLDLVRSDISILLHHDAITGTSSPTAEYDWL